MDRVLLGVFEPKTGGCYEAIKLVVKLAGGVSVWTRYANVVGCAQERPIGSCLDPGAIEHFVEVCIEQNGREWIALRQSFT